MISMGTRSAGRNQPAVQIAVGSAFVGTQCRQYFGAGQCKGMEIIGQIRVIVVIGGIGSTGGGEVVRRHGINKNSSIGSIVPFTLR